MHPNFLRLKPFSRPLLCAALFYTIAPGSRNKPWARIYAESGSSEQWPKTRPVITDRSGQPQRGEKSRQPPKNHPNAPESIETRDEDFPLFEDEESAAWASFSAGFSRVRESLTAIPWSLLRGKVADHVLPEWAQMLPDYVTKLQTEIEMGADSLAHTIWVCSLRKCVFTINVMLSVKDSVFPPR